MGHLSFALPRSDERIPAMPTLNSAQLPEGSLKRQSSVKRKFWRDEYVQKFDQSTLWYDVIWSRGVLKLIAPHPKNLWTLFKRAEYFADGKPVRAQQMKRFYRHMEITFADLSERPHSFEMMAGKDIFSSTVSESEHHLFYGKNMLLLISRDNDLEWVKRNIVYHQQYHGLEAVLIFDNASETYSARELADVVSETGIDNYLVVPANFPFGPHGLRPYANTELFLQTALYNIAKYRWLSSARAVLCVDVDELVHAPSELSVFDAAHASRFGYVRFRERKVFLPPYFKGNPRHADHTYHMPSGKRWTNTKWCISPENADQRLVWRAHQVEGSLLNLLPATREFTYLHYQNLNTGWKSPSRLLPPRNGTRDRVAQTVSDQLLAISPQRLTSARGRPRENDRAVVT